MKSKIFTAQLDYLHKMLEFVEAYALTKQFPTETINKIILATEEALVNIINYSYPNSKGFIKISCKDCIKKAGLIIQLKDEGVPFNPIEQSLIKKGDSPPLPSMEEGAKKGGYGIYIFVGIMDRVSYKRLKNGNLLTLTKYLN